MNPGDVCIQRGTIHAWNNPFDEPARVYFVLTGKFELSSQVNLSRGLFGWDCEISPTDTDVSSAAIPLEVGGKKLEPTGFKHEEMASGGH